MAAGHSFRCRKVPARKALKDFGLTTTIGAEQYWYVLMCMAFGVGYFANIPIAKAISELPQFQSEQQAQFGTLSQVPSRPTMAPIPPTATGAPISPGRLGPISDYV
jgi:hypothetical protein